jgi:hypothetical protein
LEGAYDFAHAIVAQAGVTKVVPVVAAAQMTHASSSLASVS